MKYETKKHCRIYHFKNGDTLYINGVTLLDERLKEGKIGVSNSEKRYIVNLEQVNYTEVRK